jgi:exodeoxyribonuclease VII large subunit
MQPTELVSTKNIYTVSQLNSEVRLLLEEAFPFVWVEGEISNFAAPHSGHWYFSLKDSHAQVRCAMFKSSQRNLDFIPKDGMHILIKARVSLYENRGEFQLIAESMEERGEGKLRLAFEILKKKLEAAGLFDPTHKKTLAPFPKQIGVITSATGAAIRDILSVLKRRYPCVPIIIYPTLVQGDSAALAISKAIQTANNRHECDLLLLARGGGSLEDLWPFNEEIVAHAIHQSHIPIISGVGHETDFTIADFVADQRAPTPSAAAEMAVPDCLELIELLRRFKQQIERKMQQQFHAASQRLLWMQKHLHQQHPKRLLTEKMQQLDFWEHTLLQLQQHFLTKKQKQLYQLYRTLHVYSPLQCIQQEQHRIQFHQQKIQHLMNATLQRQQTQLAQAAATLDALSPLATLKRGYAIAMTQDQHVLYKATEVKSGDAITIQLLEGSLECEVYKIHPA